ncbi:MAG: hypothetical protein ACR2IF_10300 [Terriglobales bacterium]
MRKLFMAVAVVALLALPMMAQDHPKFDIFGGYQLTHISPGVTGTPSSAFNGWNAAVTGWLNGTFGITADFSGAYKKNPFGFVPPPDISTHQYTYMFGPTIASHSNPKFTPFAHFLIGGASAGADTGTGPFGAGGTASSHSLALAFGGGLDVGGKKVKFRVGQFDYLMTRFFHDTLNVHQNDFRYSAGVVFSF